MGSLVPMKGDINDMAHKDILDTYMPLTLSQQLGKTLQHDHVPMHKSPHLNPIGHLTGTVIKGQDPSFNIIV